MDTQAEARRIAELVESNATLADALVRIKIAAGLPPNASIARTVQRVSSMRVLIEGE